MYYSCPKLICQHEAASEQKGRKEWGVREINRKQTGVQVAESNGTKKLRKASVYC